MTQARLHATLGVGRDATADELRNAYRLLSLRHHPEGRGGDPSAERFREVGAAYQALVKGIAAPDGISNRRAHDLFDEAMCELGAELARMGYDEVFIYRALAEEGCPAELATRAARQATSSAPRQRERAGPWSFAGNNPLPMLPATPPSALGPATKLLAFGLFACLMLAAVAVLVPGALSRVQQLVEPLRSIALPQEGEKLGDFAEPARMPVQAAPQAAPQVVPVSAPRRRAVPSPQPAAGADSCTTDRDCVPGYRCMRASTHEAWSCRPG